MRLVIAECSVTYAGRLNAYLPPAKRLIMIKADGAVLVHSDGGSYKPLNWMTPPAKLLVSNPPRPSGKRVLERSGRCSRRSQMTA